MCGPRETPWDVLSDEVSEKIEEIIKTITIRADNIMKEDPDSQPYKTPSDERRRAEAIEFIEQVINIIR